MARPTDLTPELQAKFCALVRRGNYPCRVAILCGIDTSTYTRWMQRGQKGEEPFCTFRTMVKEAEVESEAWLEGLMAAAAEADPKNWKAAESLIARRFPRRWGLPAKPAAAPELPGRSQFPKLTDGEFWDRYEAETKELAERLEIIAERRRLLKESDSKHLEASSASSEELPTASLHTDPADCK